MKHRLLYNQRTRPLVVRRENAVECVKAAVSLLTTRGRLLSLWMAMWVDPEGSCSHLRGNKPNNGDSGVDSINASQPDGFRSALWTNQMPDAIWSRFLRPSGSSGSSRREVHSMELLCFHSSTAAEQHVHSAGTLWNLLFLKFSLI